MSYVDGDTQITTQMRPMDDVKKIALVTRANDKYRNRFLDELEEIMGDTGIITLTQTHSGLCYLNMPSGFRLIDKEMFAKIEKKAILSIDDKDEENKKGDRKSVV